MKRMVNRVLARLAMFLIAIILGAIAVAQAQKGFQDSRVAKNAGTLPASVPVQAAPYTPIPMADSLSAANMAASSPAGNSDYVTQPPREAPVASPAEFAPPRPMNGDFAPPEYAGPPPAADAQYPAADEFASAGQFVPAEIHNRQVQPTAGEFNDGELPAAETDAMSLPPAVRDDEEIELPPITGVPAPLQPAQQMPPTQVRPAPRMSAPSMPSPDNYMDQPYPGMEQAPAHDDGYDDEQGFPPQTNEARALEAESNPYYRDTEAVSPPARAVAPPPRQTFASSHNQGPLLSAAATASQRAIASAASTGKPGPKELEGPQTPTLSVTKKSPQEVQVGKPAKFHIVVRNTGQVPAHEVVIRDQVPHGTQLVDTNPPAQSDADGAILWEMGTLRPGSEVTVMMELLPLEEGDIGSVATVGFEAAASSRTLVTKPQLTLEHTTARQVLVGEEVVFNIRLSNPGTGVATNVTIEENVPQGLQHFNGQELEYQVGTLRPGESRILELTLKADKPGMVQNNLIARADGNIEVQDTCELEVVAPALRVEITGPRRRYLERRASYEIHVANPGTAAAHNVELVAHLPRALRFVKTNNSGTYDPQRHVVIWNLAELPAQEMGTVQIDTTPVQMGDHAIQVDARASMGLADSVEHHVAVDGLAALLYTVTDVSDPIEVGGETTYKIQIVNQGSKEATNLQLGALIPSGMEALSGEGPTKANIQGAQCVFEPLPRLGPQATADYQIHVKGVTPGDKRIQIQLLSDDINEPVTKEESTHVYADE